MRQAEGDTPIRPRARFGVLAWAAWFAVLGAPPATLADSDIRAAAVSADGALSARDDPMAALWARVPERTIELSLAPPLHQSIALLHAADSRAAAPLRLGVSAVSDGQRIYFRLRWKDGTKDDRRAIGVFPDSAAIEVPVTPQETSPIMGMPDRPVHIWRWDAAANAVEPLVAASPGALEKARIEKLRGKGVYAGLGDAGKREWLVVISQDLDEAAEGAVRLRSRGSFPVAFAVWQGSERQRGGFKHVSNWVSVSLEPRP